MKLLMKKALNELTNLQSGEFLLKDLFKGYEWNRLDRNIRLKLGILFLNEINTNSYLNIKAIEKTSSN
ncbi:single-stranded DNA-binding protein [uncultured Clostridium sp.]|uniref:single-stranded DNA-binding protein n=1 Tax=uncultured Clostridium sp. TaxID=59620 RepID=UPI002673856F|nr:single-stranded DNA-binding protein [uncultured Clostridium sp.]